MAKTDDKDQAVDPKPKKVLTDEEKKTRTLLIVMGVLAVVTALIYVPPMFSAKPGPQLPVAPQPAAGPGGTPAPANPLAPSATPGGKPENGTNPETGAGTSGTGGTGGATGSSAPMVAPIPRYRQDPMQPFYTNPISPDPTPTPIPPVPLPEPRAQINLPSLRGGAQASFAIVGLPTPRIARMTDTPTGPQVTGPPRRKVGETGGGGEPVPAYNKRLSGIIIGDGVRALLEINNGDQLVTRVVQPGDEVDGLTVLSIKRQTEGNRVITRMVVRENGEERYVDLKPSTTLTTTKPGGGP